MPHLQHEVKQLQPVAVSLQVLCDVEIQNTQRLCLDVHTLSVLWKKYNKQAQALMMMEAEKILTVMRQEEFSWYEKTDVRKGQKKQKMQLTRRNNFL